jgi:hypothetical protein
MIRQVKQKLAHIGQALEPEPLGSCIAPGHLDAVSAPDEQEQERKKADRQDQTSLTQHAPKWGEHVSSRLPKKHPPTFQLANTLYPCVGRQNGEVLNWMPFEHESGFLGLTECTYRGKSQWEEIPPPPLSQYGIGKHCAILVQDLPLELGNAALLT